MTSQFVYFSLIIRCGRYTRHTRDFSTRTEYHSAIVGAYIGSNEKLWGNGSNLLQLNVQCFIGIGLEFNMARYPEAKKTRLVIPSWITTEEDERQHRKYCRNKIKTTKYTFLSFIPKNLFEQLHRFANIYFIFLAALNFVPIVNAFQPEIGVIPILLVMSITAVKDLWEDQRRRISDRQANSLLCKLYNR